MTELGVLVKECRQEHGFTQIQLAKKLGYNSAQFISMVENGRVGMAFGKMRKICKVLDIPRVHVRDALMDDYYDKISGEFGLGSK